MKYLISRVAAILFALTPVLLFAQNTAATSMAATPSDTLFNDIMTVVLLTIGGVVIIAALILMLKTNLLLYKKVMQLQDRIEGIEAPIAPIVPEGDDFWTRMRKKYWENPVPIEQEGEIQMNHDYDGIRELDNSLPPWWVTMFYLTILFAAVYMWYYHFGGNGTTSAQEYTEELAYNKKQRAMALLGQANAVDESNVAALTDVAKLGEGEIIFKANCASCHGQLGEGGVGPNMTDAHWLHGGGIANVFKVVKYGVPSKGMIAWQDQLRPADIQKVSSYILTLAGTNPPNPKDPQGQIWVDTTKVTVVPVAATPTPASGK